MFRLAAFFCFWGALRFAVLCCAVLCCAVLCGWCGVVYMWERFTCPSLFLSPFTHLNPLPPVGRTQIHIRRRHHGAEPRQGLGGAEREAAVQDRPGESFVVFCYIRRTGEVREARCWLTGLVPFVVVFWCFFATSVGRCCIRRTGEKVSETRCWLTCLVPFVVVFCFIPKIKRLRSTRCIGLCADG